MLNEKSFDELLQMAVTEACLEEACEIEEQAMKDKYVFSSVFENKMKSVLHRKSNKKGKSMLEAPLSPRRPKLKYLLVAILLLILSSVTVLAYEPVRNILKEFFYTTYHDHILIHPERHDGKEDEELIKINLLKPSYVPDGYELIDESMDETLEYISLVWLNEEEEILAYEQRRLGKGEIILSAEGTEPMDISIGEITGKFISEKDGMKSIFYEKDKFIFIISGYLEKEALLQILGSIE